MTYEIHEAANAFPMMGSKELGELAKDIQCNGLQVPIRIYDNKILDGRNRLAACLQVGIEPRYELIEVDDPFLWVWSLNGERRHLASQEQKALIWSKLHGMSDSMQSERERIKAAGSTAKSEAQQGNQNAMKNESCTDRTTFVSKPKPKEAKTRNAEAKAAGVNVGAMARAQALEKAAPELAEKVAAGELKYTQANKLLKHQQITKEVEALPLDQYRVIYADPPWKYGDERAMADYSGTSASDHYPTMPTSDICALDIRSMAHSDSVLFMWATFPLLDDAFDVIKAWGFKYKTAFVWNKKRPNMGNYHNASAELLMIATRGSATPAPDVKRFDQVQEVERTGRHSEKPEHFRSMIDAMYPAGNRIELFRRGEAPTGWQTWGNEAE